MRGARPPKCAVAARSASVEARSRAESPLSLSGLDLNKDADVRTLYQRLQRASFDVCKKVVGPMMTIEVGKCASDLLDVAVSQVNRPALTALHGRPVLELSASR